MKELVSFSSLMTDMLQQQYSAEQQQRESLEQIKTKVFSSALLGLLVNYADDKEQNLDRLQRCFKLLQIIPPLRIARIVKAVISQTRFNMNNSGERYVAEAALIAGLQQINHLNICAYGTIAAFAQALQLNEVARLTHDALQSEKQIDRQLSRLAIIYINPEAVTESEDC